MLVLNKPLFLYALKMPNSINFLGKQGWKLVNAYPKAEETYTKFVFKKEFLRSDLKNELSEFHLNRLIVNTGK